MYNYQLLLIFLFPLAAFSRSLVPAVVGVADESSSSFFEDDMLITEQQFQHIMGSNESKAMNRNAYLWRQYYWPHRTLVYSFTKDFLNSEIELVKNAMQDISLKTCVRFRQTYNPYEPQVVFQKHEAGCFSAVGYRAKRQKLNLGKGCMRQQFVQHELLHSLAFLHMQNDPQRDKYVRILFGNIINGKEHNFIKYSARDVSDFGVGYDFNSLLHYGSHTFSKNGRPTIDSRRPGIKFGGATELSSKDIRKLNLIYCNML